MPQFDAGRGFQRRLNVRDFGYLLHLLEEKDSYPHGVLWPLVAARRGQDLGARSARGPPWQGTGIVHRPPRHECQISGEAEV